MAPSETAPMLPFVPFGDCDHAARELRSKRRLSVTLTLILAIAIGFMFLSLVTPGWNTTSATINGLEISTHDGIFYSTGCVNSTCLTMSHLDKFRDGYELIGSISRPKYVRDYNIRVHRQINVQVAWFLVVFVFLFHLVRLLKGKEYPRVTLLSGIAMVVVCDLMFEKLFDAFIEIDFARRAMDLSNAVDGTVGFPYSLLFFILSFIQCTVVLTLIFKQTLDHMNNLTNLVANAKIKEEANQRTWDAIEGAGSRKGDRDKGRHPSPDVHLRIPRDREIRSSDRRRHDGDFRRDPRRIDNSSPRNSREMRHEEGYLRPPDRSRSDDKRSTRSSIEVRTSDDRRSPRSSMEVRMSDDRRSPRPSIEVETSQSRDNREHGRGYHNSRERFHFDRDVHRDHVRAQRRDSPDGRHRPLKGHDAPTERRSRSDSRDRQHNEHKQNENNPQERHDRSYSRDRHHNEQKLNENVSQHPDGDTDKDIVINPREVTLSQNNHDDGKDKHPIEVKVMTQQLEISNNETTTTVNV